eukprot:6637817-Alexandrium_andersonii.AAC.1
MVGKKKPRGHMSSQNLRRLRRQGALFLSKDFMSRLSPRRPGEMEVAPWPFWLRQPPARREQSEGAPNRGPLLEDSCRAEGFASQDRMFPTI